MNFFLAYEQVAGYFNNTAALRLYMDYGFKCVANFEGASVLMCTLAFEEPHYLRICGVTERTLEAMFLLPKLKRRFEQQISDEGDAGVLQSSQNEEDVSLRFGQLYGHLQLC